MNENDNFEDRITVKPSWKKKKAQFPVLLEKKKGLFASLRLEIAGYDIRYYG